MSCYGHRTRIATSTIVGVLCILTLTACGDGVRRPPDLSTIEPEFSHEALGYTWLKATHSAASDSLGWPADVLVVDGRVVVTDYPSGGSAVHVFTAGSLRHVLSFGRLGDGPGEFRGPPSVLKAAEDGAFWTYDGNQARLTLYRFADVQNGEFKGAEHIPLIVERIMYELAFLDRDRAVGLGLFSGGRFALVDLRTADIRFTGTLPASKDATPPHVVQNAYLGKLAAHPSGSRFALATAHGGIIEIYDGDGSLLHSADTPFPFEPDYQAEPGGNGPRMARGFLNRGGYVGLDATQDFIFALFSGRAQGHFLSSYRDAEYLHVLDWEGNLVRVFRFDRLVSDIAVSRDGNTLFAIVSDPEPAVLSYSLPAVVAAPEVTAAR